MSLNVQAFFNVITIDFHPNYHDLHTMLTPKQQNLLDNNPAVQLLISQLDCQVLPSHEYKYNNAVAKQVDKWLSGFSQTTHKPRTVTTMEQEAAIAKIVTPAAPIEATYTFKAWKSVAGKTITCIF